MLRELARSGTIAATARALGLTPSAVSQQLSALEREAGVALIDRADRRATLTPAGHALVGHADRVLDALAAASAELDRVRGAVGGPFRIATVPSAAPALVSPVVARLRAAHPDLDLTVIDEEPHRSLDHLDRGTIDLAVVDRYAAAPLPLGRDLDARPLLVEPLLAVLPAGHPALRRRRSGPSTWPPWPATTGSSPPTRSAAAPPSAAPAGPPGSSPGCAGRPTTSCSTSSTWPPATAWPSCPGSASAPASPPSRSAPSPRRP